MRLASSPDLLVAQEVMARLRVSRSTLGRWDRDGTLPAVRLGPKVVRWRREDVEALLRRGTSAAS